MLFELSNVLVELLRDRDPKVLILNIFIHGALHLTHDPSHEYLRHMIHLNVRMSEEKFRQVLKEEAEERVFEDGVLHRLEYLIEIVDVLGHRRVTVELSSLIEAK